MPYNINQYIVHVLGDNDSWEYSSSLANTVNVCFTNGNTGIISMSLDGSGPSTTKEATLYDMYTDEIMYTDAAVNYRCSRFSYLASYDDIIYVVATNINNDIASFSKRNTQVDLAATAVDLISTLSYPGKKLETFTVGVTAK